LVEAGCGAQPQLSASVLDTWKQESPGLLDSVQVILVERSAARLERAVETLRPVLPGKIYGCPDIGQVPKVTGAVVSNELLDAFPVRLLRRTDQDLIEEACVEAAADGRRRWEWKICADPVLTSFGLELPQGAAYAYNEEALRFLEAAAGSLEHGLICTIDYGDCRPQIFRKEDGLSPSE
jgi:SAM-dependent MidA family methyltransferase